MHKLLKSGLIRFREPPDIGTVDIQNAPDLSLYMDGHNDLRIGCAIAGDMSGKLMNIVDELSFIRCYSSTAHTLAHRNADTGGLALKWP